MTARRQRTSLMWALLLALLALLPACAGGGDEQAAEGGESGRPAPAQEPAPALPTTPSRVNALVAMPGERALLAVTDAGLFRIDLEQGEAARIDSTIQNRGQAVRGGAGFATLGADGQRLLASGHPDQSGPLPDALGLLESQDEGASWTPVSLFGESDLHIVRGLDDTVYAVEAGTERLRVSGDGGTTWTDGLPPAPLRDLVIDPDDADTIVGATDSGIFASSDRGQNWEGLSGGAGGQFLLWPEPDALYQVTAAGQVSRSTDRGRSSRELGRVEGPPSAVAALDADTLFAAVGPEVLRSTDGGRTFERFVALGQGG